MLSNLNWAQEGQIDIYLLYINKYNNILLNYEDELDIQKFCIESFD